MGKDPRVRDDILEQRDYESLEAENAKLQSKYERLRDACNELRERKLSNTFAIAGVREMRPIHKLIDELEAEGK